MVHEVVLNSNYRASRVTGTNTVKHNVVSIKHNPYYHLAGRESR